MPRKSAQLVFFCFGIPLCPNESNSSRTLSGLTFMYVLAVQFTNTDAEIVDQVHSTINSLILGLQAKGGNFHFF